MIAKTKSKANNQIEPRFKAKLLVVGSEEDFHQEISGIFASKSLNLSFSGDPTFELAYAVYWCKTVKDTWEIVSTLHPDILLIADDTLDCPKLIADIRDLEDSRHTGIIVFERSSRKNQQIASLESFELGADDYIDHYKPKGEIVARIVAVIRLKIMTDELRRANHQLELLSRTDELTGLHNMRSFHEYYQDRLELAKRTKSGFGIIMLDLDRFKSINDNTNHLVGSFIIGEIGKLLRFSGIFGEQSCIARYGGDEYIIAMPCQSEEDLVANAETFRSMVESATFEREQFVLTLTVSIGCCFVSPAFDGDVNDPVKCADFLLYQSKDLGRNRVSSMSLEGGLEFANACRDYQALKEASGQKLPNLRYKTLKIIK